MSVSLNLHEPQAAATTEPLVTYAYSYPHKSSYRPLVPAESLADIWRDEDRRHLALYVHLPFCEMRCGFCNLFTQSQPKAERVTAYLQALARHMYVVREAVPDARFATFAMGGGTPTMLEATQLSDVLRRLEATFEFRLRDIPTSIETSPATATRERLDVLAEHGIERISLGVQSFVSDDNRAIGRPQRADEVHRALELIRELAFPVLNIDLIYGDPEQSRASWLDSLRTALSYQPEELYLYPLYVRPETGLAKAGHAAAAQRLDLYRVGRALLLEHGYEQLSLRCFRRLRASASTTTYSCQNDGMIGLGCGARSYTSNLHYATEFAVSQAGVRAILNRWMSLPDAELSLATHGMRLSLEEQRRRFVILNVLQAAGLCQNSYIERFGTTPQQDFPELLELCERGWLSERSSSFVLTEAGMENSDVIGPLLYSPEVRDRLREFVQR